MTSATSLTASLRRLWPRAQRLLFELTIVFVGVFAALWVDGRREGVDRRDRALQIADAVGAEITDSYEWYGPWRDSIEVNYADWQRRVGQGERPVPYFFRVPGSEHVSSVGWQAAVEAGVLQVFPPALVFEMGRAYHEWSDIGDRIARYHASTEAVIFPEIGLHLISSPDYPYASQTRRDTNLQWQERLAEHKLPSAYDASGRLLPRFAANMALMEETLANMDSRYEMAYQFKMRLDSAVASIVGSP